MNSSTVFDWLWLRCIALAAGDARAVRVADAAAGGGGVGARKSLGRGFPPDGRFLVTEKPGRMRIVGADGKLGAPLAGVPAVAGGGQGGLLDVLADSAFAAQPHLLFLLFRARGGRLGQRHGAGARAAVGRRQPPRRPEGDLQPASQGRQPQPLRLPHRRGQGRHAVPDPGRPLQPQGRRAEARQPPRQDRAHRQGRQRRPQTTPSSAAPARCPRSGATATATARAPRWRPTAGSGCTSTARRAATRSTSRRPGATTAGR